MSDNAESLKESIDRSAKQAELGEEDRHAGEKDTEGKTAQSPDGNERGAEKIEKEIGDNMKLFEIPVYALTKESLDQRVEYAFKAFEKEYSDRPEISTEHIKECFNIEAFPPRIWEYNHIVGYVVISQSGADIELEWYAPLPSLQKYYWKSRIKHFVQNTNLNGYHFYTGNLKTGEQLRERVNGLVDGFAKELKKRGYYADLEAFKNIDAFLDYSQLLKG